jgi:hypothetical protein
MNLMGQKWTGKVSRAATGGVFNATRGGYDHAVGYGLRPMTQGGVLSYAGAAGGGGSVVTVDMRGSTIYGVDDLENRIHGAVNRANDVTATKLRKKASY